MDHETTNENDFRSKSYKLPRGVYAQHEGNTLVWTCDFSKTIFAENHTFFSGTCEGLIKTWTCFSEKPLCTFLTHRLPIKCLIYLSNKQIASGSQDKTIKIWTLNGDETSEFICAKTLNGHQGGIKCILKAKDEKMIFSGSCDTTIKMWHLNTGICLRTFQGHEDRVDCLELNRDKSKLLSGSKDATIKIWDISKGECIRTLMGHTSCVTCLCYNVEKREIISGSGDRTIKIWNSHGSLLDTLSGHTNWVTTLILLSSGDLVTAAQDKTIRIWSMMKRDNLFCLKTLHGHQMAVWCLAVLPCGQLVSGSNDSTIRVWSLRDAKCKKVLAAQKNRNICLALRTFF